MTVFFGRIQARWNSKSKERLVEDPCENHRQLVWALLQHPSCHTIRAGRLLWVHCPKHVSYIMLLHCESVAVGGLWRCPGWSHCFWFITCKETITFLCQRDVAVSGLSVAGLIIGEMLNARPHLPWVLVIELAINLAWWLSGVLFSHCSIRYTLSSVDADHFPIITAEGAWLWCSRNIGVTQMWGLPHVSTPPKWKHPLYCQNASYFSPPTMSH